MPGLYNWAVYLGCITGLYNWVVYLGCIPGSWIVYPGSIPRLYTQAVYPLYIHYLLGSNNVVEYTIVVGSSERYLL